MKGLCLVLAVLIAACASPSKRIKRNQALFDTFPPAVQEKVRQGQVDVGFTADMVLIALGKPDRKYTRKTEAGDTEIWAYVDGHRPGYGFSLGLGTGYYGRSSVYSGGVTVGSGPADYHYDEKTRVVLSSGTVTSVESRDTP